MIKFASELSGSWRQFGFLPAVPGRFPSVPAGPPLPTDTRVEQVTKAVLQMKTGRPTKPPSPGYESDEARLRRYLASPIPEVRTAALKAQSAYMAARRSSGAQRVMHLAKFSAWMARAEHEWRRRTGLKPMMREAVRAEERAVPVPYPVPALRVGEDCRAYLSRCLTAVGGHPAGRAPRCVEVARSCARSRGEPITPAMMQAIPLGPGVPTRPPETDVEKKQLEAEIAALKAQQAAAEAAAKEAAEAAAVAPTTEEFEQKIAEAGEAQQEALQAGAAADQASAALPTDWKKLAIIGVIGSVGLLVVSKLIDRKWPRMV